MDTTTGMVLKKEDKFFRFKVSKTKIIFWLCLIAFVGFILARNLLQINLPDILAVGLSAIVFFVLPVEYGIIFYAFLIPFKTGIGMHSITLVYCCVAALRHFRKKGAVLQGKILLFAIVLVLEIINVSLGEGNYMEMFRYAVYLVWIYFTYEQLEELSWNKQIIVKVLKAFIWGLVIASLIVVIINSQNMTLTGLLSGSVRIGKTAEYSSLESMLISFHVNDLSMFCAIAISFIVVLVLRRNMGILLGVIGIIYFIFIGLLTQSRTFILMISLITLYLIIVNSKNRWKYLIVIGVIVVIVVWTYQMGYLPVIDSIMNRFKGSDMLTANHRTEIVAAYNNLLLSNPIRLFTGYGVLDYREYATVGSAHNGTQEMLVSCGIIGSICLMSWFGLFGKRAQQSAKRSLWKNSTNYTPLMVYLLGVQATQFVSQYHMFCILIFTLMAIGLGEKENVKTDYGKYS